MASSSGKKTFRAWILDVGRWGDTQQMRILAEATPGLEYDVVSLAPRKAYPKLRRVPRHSIAWLDENSRSLLSPPWPDVVFLAGRGAVSVALWIRRRNSATRLVAIGRPFAPLHLFDLVVSSPAYFPPQRPNVLNLPAPLHVLDMEKLLAARRRWKKRLAELPSPRIAVLVGGTSSPYRFTPDEAAHLGREMSALARRNAGSLLVTTNHRVSAASTQALFEAISAPAYLHDCRNEQDNPYLAFLALADAIVVTVDSLSMMTDAASTNTAEVMIFPLRRERRFVRDALDHLYDFVMHRPFLAPVQSLLCTIEAQGILVRRADRQAFAEALVRKGHARWFSTDVNLRHITKERRPLDMREELDRAVQRLLRVLHGEHRCRNA